MDSEMSSKPEEEEQASLAKLIDDISDISHCGPGNDFHQRLSLEAQGAQQIKSPTSPEESPFAPAKDINQKVNERVPTASNSASTSNPCVGPTSMYASQP